MVRLLEHQAKNLLSTAGVPTPRGELAATVEQAREISERFGKPVAIKAQVSTTGRFKAGGIGFADNPDEAARVAERMLGSRIKGLVIKEVLVEEKLDVEKEFYAGIIVDDSQRAKSPVLIFSIRGGVDIEQVAAEHPEEVSRLTLDVLGTLALSEVESLVRSLGVPSGLAESLSKVVYGVYQVFSGYDARSVEVNPIVLTSDGMVWAADCRIVLDESSASKHSELGMDFPRDIGRAPTDLERVAWRIEENDFRGIAYFVQMATDFKPCDGYIGFQGIGGGAAMLGADALIRQGLKIANYADTSGNPTASKVYRIVKIIFSQPNIDGYALMGAVVANQEQWHHAHALVRALREELPSRPNFPVVILIAGNKEQESIEILKQGLQGLPARIEVYGRDYVYNVDYLAQRVKILVDNYNRLRMSDRGRQ